MYPDQTLNTHFVSATSIGFSSSPLGFKVLPSWKSWFISCFAGWVCQKGIDPACQLLFSSTNAIFNVKGLLFLSLYILFCNQFLYVMVVLFEVYNTILRLNSGCEAQTCSGVIRSSCFCLCICKDFSRQWQSLCSFVLVCHSGITSLAFKLPIKFAFFLTEAT